MNQVIQEASLRQVNSVYAYVRADNKVSTLYRFDFNKILISGCNVFEQKVWVVQERRV